MEISKEKSFSVQNKNMRVFFNKNLKKTIFSYLPRADKDTIKACFNLFNWKDRKRIFKKALLKYLKDTDSQKFSYKINADGSISVFTSIFNLQSDFLLGFTKIHHKDTGDEFRLVGEELEQYMKLLRGTHIIFTDEQNFIKVTKNVVIKEEIAPQNEEKFKDFYEETGGEVDYRDQTALREQQKERLAKMNKKTAFFERPLQFISEVSAWSVILCQGGYFAYGFFKGDKNLEHKSDQKYVTRKKAGKRQVLKDKTKKIRTSRLTLT